MTSLRPGFLLFELFITHFDSEIVASALIVFSEDQGGSPCKVKHSGEVET